MTHYHPLSTESCFQVGSPSSSQSPNDSSSVEETDLSFQHMSLQSSLTLSDDNMSREQIPQHSVHPKLSDFRSLTKTNPFHHHSVPIDRRSGVRFISSGFGYTLLLTLCGDVYGWGRNERGQLLDIDFAAIESPVKLPITNVVSISAGYSHSLALSSEGNLYGWGCNEDNQIYMSENHSLPLTHIEIPYKIEEFYAGQDCSFALTQEGQVVKWGKFNSFQIIEDLNNIVFISNDDDLFVAIDRNNDFFYYNTTTSSVTKFSVSNYLIPQQIFNNSVFFNCFLVVIDIKGEVWMFDRGDDPFTTKPTKVPGLSYIVSISGYGGVCAAIDNNGKVFVWGDLSTVSEFYKKDSDYKPRCIEAFTNIEGISISHGFLFAYNKNTAWAWGRNDNGQLGAGDLIDRPQPVKVFGSEILGRFHHSKQPLDRMFSGLIKLIYVEYLDLLKKLFGFNCYSKARFYTKCSISKKVAKFAKQVINGSEFLKNPNELTLNFEISDLNLQLSDAFNGPQVINTGIKKLDVYYNEVDYDPKLLSYFPNVEVVKLDGWPIFQDLPSILSLNSANFASLKHLELNYPFEVEQLPTSLVKLVLIGYFDVVDLSYLTSLQQLVLHGFISAESFVEGLIPAPEDIIKLELLLWNIVSFEIKLPYLKELVINCKIPSNISEQNFPSLKFIQLIRPDDNSLSDSTLSPTKHINQGLIQSVELIRNEYLVELSCFPWWIQYPAERSLMEIFRDFI
ncbi:hypothetical protein P9112_006927 [Eukaryota sp. TZLM1-RC]